MTLSDRYQRRSMSATGLRVIGWVLSILLVYLVLVTSMRLLMTPAYLFLEYQRPGFPADEYGFTTQDRLEYGPLGVDYLTGYHPIAFLERMLPGDRCSPQRDRPCAMFDEFELSHMHDVQDVVQPMFQLGLIVLLAAVIICGALLYQSRLVLYRALRNASIAIVASVITLAVIAVTAWRFFFTTLHQLFFAEGTWQFAFSDTLIRLYPQQFWFDSVIVLGGLIIAFAGILWLLSQWILLSVPDPQ